MWVSVMMKCQRAAEYIVLILGQWESDKAIEIGENALLISIKRKWHLFRPVTVEAEIIK